MTEQHPLTDRDVAQYVIKEIRIAYDKGSNDMLDRVIEQWEEVINSNKTDIQIIREFDKRLKAMLPQENNNV